MVYKHILKALCVFHISFQASKTGGANGSVRYISNHFVMTCQNAIDQRLMWN